MPPRPKPDDANPYRKHQKVKDEEKVPVEILSEYSRKILELVLYDVENCQALRNFARVKDHTDCIFAKKSILWGAQDYDQELSVGVLGNGALLLKVHTASTSVCMSGLRL